MEYKIIGITTSEILQGIETLEEKVNCSIMEGWVPQGGVHCVQSIGEMYTITQAMILREENDK